MEIFNFYGIEGKVLMITFDNMSVNIVTINMFKLDLKLHFGGKDFHQWCTCYIINLVVSVGIEYISFHLTKFRESLTFISSSGDRL